MNDSPITESELNQVQFMVECINSTGFRKWICIKAETKNIAMRLVLAKFPNWKVMDVIQLYVDF